MEKLPPLNSLRAFDAAQRHMSFQDAAAELFVTPAALSYQIRQLEEHLGLKLFHRLNRAVELTQEGRLIAPGIEESFASLRHTLTLLSRNKRANILVVSAGPAFASKWLTPRIYRFLARYPDIDLRISASMERANLSRDDVDIALRFGIGEYPNCSSIKLLDEYLTPMCSPHLVTISKPLKTPRDIRKFTIIHDDTHIGMFGLPDWDQWFKEANRAGKTTSEPETRQSGLHFDAAYSAIDAAIAGAGIILGRTVLADAELKTGRLIAPFDIRLKADFSFFAVINEARTGEKNIQRFIEWIMEEAAGNPDVTTPIPAV